MSNKVALITGSGRPRVGFEIAKSLAECGFDIALHYHSSAEQAEEGANQLRRHGIQCEAFNADVANEDDVNHLFDQVASKFRRLDVLVTTSAIWKPIKLEETTAEDVQQFFNINTLGTFLCARRAGLMMAAQATGGSIITIGDWAIDRPYADHAAYFLSKGAIPTLTRTLAVELAQRNPRVRVNCIHPGPVMLPPDTSDAHREARVESTLVKMADDPTVIAQAVKFLIENPFVTGACLPVCGGRSIFAGESNGQGLPI